MPQSPSATMIVADDITATRDSILWFLREAAVPVRVVAEAATGGEAVELARRLRPDVVLIDARMPVMNGVTATRLIVNSVPATRVIVISAHDDESIRSDAVDAGAFAFVNKNDGAQLERVIKQALLAGETGPEPGSGGTG